MARGVDLSKVATLQPGETRPGPTPPDHDWVQQVAVRIPKAQLAAAAEGMRPSLHVDNATIAQVLPVGCLTCGQDYSASVAAGDCPGPPVGIGPDGRFVYG